jgi:hypothetical protein
MSTEKQGTEGPGGDTEGGNRAAGRQADGILYEERSYAAIGAAMAVHKKLGPGFLEAVYHWALLVEFDERAIRHEAEKRLPVHASSVGPRSAPAAPPRPRWVRS